MKLIEQSEKNTKKKLNNAYVNHIKILAIHFYLHPIVIRLRGLVVNPGLRLACLFDYGTTPEVLGWNTSTDKVDICFPRFRILC